MCSSSRCSGAVLRRKRCCESRLLQLLCSSSISLRMTTADLRPVFRDTAALAACASSSATPCADKSRTTYSEIVSVPQCLQTIFEDRTFSIAALDCQLNSGLLDLFTGPCGAERIKILLQNTEMSSRACSICSQVHAVPSKSKYCCKIQR